MIKKIIAISILLLPCSLYATGYSGGGSGTGDVTAAGTNIFSGQNTFIQPVTIGSGGLLVSSPTVHMNPHFSTQVPTATLKVELKDIDVDASGKTFTFEKFTVRHSSVGVTSTWKLYKVDAAGTRTEMLYNPWTVGSGLVVNSTSTFVTGTNSIPPGYKVEAECTTSTGFTDQTDFVNSWLREQE